MKGMREIASSTLQVSGRTTELTREDVQEGPCGTGALVAAMRSLGTQCPVCPTRLIPLA